MTTTSSSVSVGPTPEPTRRSGWVRVASVLALVVALAGAFLAGRLTKADTVQPADLADTTVTKLLSDYAEAVNSGDEGSIATFYTSDARLVSTIPSEQWVVSGNRQIAQAIRSWWDVLGFRMENRGSAIQKGDLVMQSHDGVFGPTMSVYQIRDGKLAGQWILLAAE